MDLKKLQQVVGVVIAIFILGWILFILSILAYKFTVEVLGI